MGMYVAEMNRIITVTVLAIDLLIRVLSSGIDKIHTCRVGHHQRFALSENEDEIEEEEQACPDGQNHRGREVLGQDFDVELVQNDEEAGGYLEQVCPVGCAEGHQ